MQTTIKLSPTTPFAAPDADPAAPSVSFIQAISQFLDTDPSDLLREMGYYEIGYYSRDTDGSSE